MTQDMCAPATPSGSQASPGAADASPPTVSIPSAVLRDLADKCESASGPDRALDSLIGIACGLRGSPFGGCVLEKMPFPIPQDAKFSRDGKYFHAVSYPPVTASLDEALVLVPEDYDWIIGRTNSGLTIHAEVGSREQFFAATPALALCAASLRARASAIEARRAATAQTGAVHESATGAAGDAPEAQP